MLCLQNCSCTKSSSRVGDSPEEPIKHEGSYVPLTETTLVSEEIPLLPKGSSMIEYLADPVQYQLFGVLGKGFDGAATISLAKHIPSGTLIAIRRTNLEACQDDIDIIQHEIAVTRQLQHENILPYYCTFVHNREIWAIQPLMAYGSARDLICAHFREGIPELAIAYILRDVLLALDYTHQRGYIHRSIRASHILISGSGKVCLSGLRYSYYMITMGRRLKCVHEYPREATNNLLWLSPEVLEQNLLGYNTKSDIYSLGITACELANGVVPFMDMPPTQMLLEKLNGTMPRLLDITTCPDLTQGVYDGQENPDGESDRQDCPYIREFSEHFHQFIESCLQINPLNRPSALQLLTHPFIKQLKKASCRLPDLLSPIRPLTDSKVLPQDDSITEEAVEKMESLEMDDWEF